MKTAELIGGTLNWAVAKAEGAPDPDLRGWSPSTKWSQGGPIIDREKIALLYHDDGSVSAITFRKQQHSLSGPTPLVAAMRCYVALKLGDEVEISEEIK